MFFNVFHNPSPPFPRPTLLPRCGCSCCCCCCRRHRCRRHRCCIPYSPINYQALPTVARRSDLSRAFVSSRGNLMTLMTTLDPASARSLLPLPVLPAAEGLLLAEVFIRVFAVIIIHHPVCMRKPSLLSRCCRQALGLAVGIAS